MAVAPLDPRFVVLSKDGIRELAMGEMYAGFGKSTLNSTAEVVKEIHIPLPADDEKASFVRLELRKSLSLPMLNVAAMAKVTGWRLPVGSHHDGTCRRRPNESF